MKKICVAVFLFINIVSFAFAGDAALFVENGFSSDGSLYVFSQYGQTDQTFRGWAEIYTVDVKNNKFVKDGVFITNPSAATANKTGKEIYTKLSAANSTSVNQSKYKPTEPNQILFISGDDNKLGTEKIIFKDFGASPVEEQASYHVQLVPTVKGSGLNVASSFFIMLEKKDIFGNVIGRQKIGTPDYFRKGVASYKIQQIVCDKSGRNIIFVVEKTVNDATGISIRYMVEAAELNPSLKVSMK